MCINVKCTVDTCTIEYGLCHCGCGKKTNYSRQDRQFRRFLKGHDKRKSPIDYLLNKDTGCWEWQLALDKDGYGTKWTDCKKYYAHRYIYEQYKGSIPAEMELDHLCRNPCCVNPDHLEIVTSVENTRRGNSTKLSLEDVVKLRELSKEINGIEIAKLYKISVAHAYRIINNKRWVL